MKQIPPTFFSPPFKPLKMSYIPGTKLSSLAANLHATVLTDSKVMMTQGLGSGQIIKLEDWLILSGGDVTVFSNQNESVQGQAPVQKEQEEEKKTATLGSKFRWHMNSDNYRVAIMTSKGVLQVKSVTDGITSQAIGRVKTIMFADEAAWRASLPQGDAITKLTDPDNRSEVEKKIERTNLSVRGLDDIQKLNGFINSFKIRTYFFSSISPNDYIDISLTRIQDIRNELKNITLEEDLEGSKRRHRLTLSLKNEIRNYNKYKYLASISVNPNIGTPLLNVCGLNRLFTNINGIEYHVSLNSAGVNATHIVIRPVSSRKSPAIVYNTLAEMGNPKICMLYRTNVYELSLY